MIVLLRIVVPALLAIGGLDARAAAPQDLCERVFVPEDLGLACAVEHGEDTAPWRIVIEPSEGPFRKFSRLDIRPVDGPITEPRGWLRRQVTLDTTELDRTLHGIFDSPDNPLTGELLTSYLDTMMDLVELVASSPLVGCGDAVPLPDGRGFEMACSWGAGGIEKYLTMRLVERDGTLYLITMESMNPRRLRHLAAIANSFEGVPGTP